MTITCKRKKNTTFIRLEGEMTIYNASELKSQLMPHLDKGSNFEIDLSQITDLDSAGIQLLMLVKQELIRDNKSLQLTAHSRAVLDVFELYNLAPFFGDPVLMSSSA